MGRGTSDNRNKGRISDYYKRAGRNRAQSYRVRMKQTHDRQGRNKKKRG